ncbi:MAG: hypothetical protein KDA73_11465 [Rhodobacteraceae bacterium]|nr:hypothetical protein [Paracoccaceae bacterium]
MATAADITIGVNLIDDYLSLAEAPVADDLVGRFVVVQNAAANAVSSELLTVSGSGELAHFYPDSSSHSGWGMGTYQVTSPVDESDTTIKRLASFYSGGVIQSLCYFDTGKTGVQAAAWMTSTSPGNWTPAVLQSDAKNALYDTYQTDTFTDADGTTYVYGISSGFGNPAFYIVMYDATAAEWQVRWVQYLNDFSPALTTASTFRMAAGATSDEMTVLWAEAETTEIYCQTVSKAAISNGESPWTGTVQSIDTSAYGAITVAQIFPFAESFGADNLLLLDTSGGLYVVSGFSGQTRSITKLTNPGAAQGVAPVDQPQPVGVVTANAGIDSLGNQRVAAIETGTSSLWYMTVDPDGQYDPTTSWVNLGGPFETIGCPATMIYGPEMFAVDLNNSVYHKALSLPQAAPQTNPIWVTRKLAQPVPSTDTPQNVSIYAMHLQAVDANGNGAGQQVLDVTADHAVTIIVNDVAHSIGPGTTVPLQTDGTGQLTVYLQAVDLKPPVITYSVSGTNASRWCQGDSIQVKETDTDPIAPPQDSVSNRLQNNDPSRVVTNASLTTSPVQPGTCPAGQDKTIPQLMSQSYAGGDPSGSACTSLQQAGSWMDPNNTHSDGAIDTSKLTLRHWRIDFDHPDGVQFQVLSEAEARAIVENARPLGSGSGAFGDVCHFFKHMFKQLSTFAATIEKDAQTGVEQLKIVFNDTIQFIISTAKDAGDAMETIFSKIADGIEAVANDVYEAIKRVIEWLKMLFNWEDILNTHLVIKNAITDGLNSLETTFDNVDAAIESWLTSVQGDLDAALEKVQQTFSNTTSYNSMVNALGPAGGAPAAASPRLGATSNTLYGTSTTNTQQQNASKCKYASSKANTYFGNQQSLSLAAAPGGTDPAQSIIDAFVDSIYENADYATYLKQLTDFVSGIFSDPQDFFDLIIQGLIEAAMDLLNLLIAAIKAVLTAIADLVADAIGVARTVLGNAPEIPILSWLYKNVIANEDLTILNLVCLVAAVPTTIVYKLMYGAGNAPFSSSDTSMAFPWPSNPFGLQAEAGVAALSADEASVSPTVARALGITGGILITLFQSTSLFTIDCAQSENMPDTEADPLVQWASWASCLTSVIGQSFGAVGIDWTGTKPSDAANIAAWSYALFPLSANLVFTFFGSKKAVTEFVDTYGNDMTTCMQLLALGFGVWQATEQGLDTEDYTGWDVAGSVIGPLPGLFDCMMSVTPLADDTVLGCAGYDLWTSIGSGIVTIGAAVADT